MSDDENSASDSGPEREDLHPVDLIRTASRLEAAPFVPHDHHAVGLGHDSLDLRLLILEAFASMEGRIDPPSSTLRLTTGTWTRMHLTRPSTRVAAASQQ